MNNNENFIVIKKDGTEENFDSSKIIKAITKSANRVLVSFTKEDYNTIVNDILTNLNKTHKENNKINILEMHSFVESALEKHFPQVAKSYRDYRDYKTSFVGILDKVYQKSQSIMYIGDKENSNSDSALVSTKRSLTYNYLNKELYKHFFLNVEELQALNDGFMFMICQQDVIL